MSKNITVTNMDGLGIADKSNMDSKSPRRKMLHEQLIDQYGIDMNNVKTLFEKTGILKILSPEWIQEIILLNLNSCKTPRSFENINKIDRVIVLNFETPKIAENFYKEFTLNMPNSVNKLITSKNENIKNYNRIVVSETTIDGCQIMLRY